MPHPENPRGRTSGESYPWRRYIEGGVYHHFNLPTPDKNVQATCGVVFRGRRYIFSAYTDVEHPGVRICQKCLKMASDDQNA